LTIFVSSIGSYRDTCLSRTFNAQRAVLHPRHENEYFVAGFLAIDTFLKEEPQLKYFDLDYFASWYSTSGPLTINKDMSHRPRFLQPCSCDWGCEESDCQNCSAWFLEYELTKNSELTSALPPTSYSKSCDRPRHERRVAGQDSPQTSMVVTCIVIYLWRQSIQQPAMLTSLVRECRSWTYFDGSDSSY
jgi:hypothetical protein